ncbi:VOC family protein [Peribacillus acanthi]|uniref:VOC family protein n=1 Tax=Peribacillus acanthi TaxID=2171554 RepID=UPI000D3E1277|nr:VOC family protein [Peribacillus acanthi]
MTEKWRPGINHIEFWVSNKERSLPFYEGLFEVIGWKKLNEWAFSTGSMEIYFKVVAQVKLDTIGPRHICFQAENRNVVDTVFEYLKRHDTKIIRGPIERNEYSTGYYTVDFYDPDGYVLEVAYTPNMIL